MHPSHTLAPEGPQVLPLGPSLAPPLLRPVSLSSRAPQAWPSASPPRPFLLLLGPSGGIARVHRCLAPPLVLDRLRGSPRARAERSGHRRPGSAPTQLPLTSGGSGRREPALKAGLVGVLRGVSLGVAGHLNRLRPGYFGRWRSPGPQPPPLPVSGTPQPRCWVSVSHSPSLRPLSQAY